VSTASAAKSATIIFSTNTSADQSSTLQYPVPAPWLADVQRRLSNSVGLATPDPDGRWLARGVVTAANALFQATSDLLSGEPHLYSSRQGDLVAEFKVADAPMTFVVSSSYALAFVVINGQAVQKKIPLAGIEPSALRFEVSQITKALGAPHNGAVDSER
jgi:hypothetical protein